VLLRADFVAGVAFFGGFLALAFVLVLVLVLAALLLFFLLVLALGRFFDLVILGLLVARAFVREDRVFAMWPR
jgi:hypothetical protein